MYKINKSLIRRLKILNKKTVINNTAIFIFVVVFVLIFKVIFGSENTLIGVTTITATLMLLGRDFTGEPLKSTLKFVGINLLMGIGSVIADANMWLAIPINFIVVFIFSYIFTYNLREPLYFAFGLQYLFLLSAPVTTDKLGTRFIALIFGALIIMLSQILVNKNKLLTSGNKLLLGVCESIENNIKCIKIKSTKVNSLESVNSSMDEFRTIVYDKRESNYYLTEEAKVKLNMSVALESINSILCRDDAEYIDSKIIDILEEIVGSAKDILNSDLNNNKRAITQSASYDINDVLNYCQQKDISDLLTLQLLECMIFLDETIVNLKELDEKDYKQVNKIGDKLEIFSKDIFKNILTGNNSPKYCYAMRMAISVVIGAFIMNYFKLEEGRWILFTILSLTSPIYEISKSKIKHRLVSTLIGSVIIILLFSIFKNETSRLLIVMLTGYLQSYVNEYKYRMIFVTVSAIGTAAVVGNVHELTVERIEMVIIGTVISIIANRYLFPYSLKNSNTQLRKLYDESIKEMFTEIDKLLDGQVRPEVMNNLLIITSLIESKSRINKQMENNKNYNDIVHERRSLVSNIYKLYIWAGKFCTDPKEQEKIHKHIKVLIEYRNEDVTDKITTIEKSIKENININTKIILIIIAIILKQLKKLNELTKKAQV